MTLVTFLTELQNLPWATHIREDDLLFPWIECFHVLSVSAVVGTISIVDLRLLGWASTDQPISSLVKSIVGLTWASFAVAAATGLLMFSANAVTYSQNVPFIAKMGLLLVAGLNMAIFHVYAGRSMAVWGAGVVPPLSARLAGAMSLTLWILVVSFGRWIGFTLK